MVIAAVMEWKNGDPADSASWRREKLPLCPRGDALISQAGPDGRVLKATGERRYGGHTVGRFPALRHQRNGPRRRVAPGRVRSPGGE